MANYNRGKNSIVSFVAMAFLLYFIGLPLVIAALLDYFGSIEEIIINTIDLIPFGESYYAISVQIVNSIGGQISNYIQLDDYLSFEYIIEELAKDLFTVIIFEALHSGVCTLLGLVDAEGIWNKAKYILITIINALIAACLSPIPLNFIFSNLDSLEKIGSTIVSLLLSVVLVGGGVAFFVFFRSLSIGGAIVYVFVKFMAMGVCRISISYFAIFVVLIGWQNGLSLLWASGALLLLANGLILSGIEMTIKSVIG